MQIILRREAAAVVIGCRVKIVDRVDPDAAVAAPKLVVQLSIEAILRRVFARPPLRWSPALSSPWRESPAAGTTPHWRAAL